MNKTLIVLLLLLIFSCNNNSYKEIDINKIKDKKEYIGLWNSKNYYMKDNNMNYLKDSYYDQFYENMIHIFDFYIKAKGNFIQIEITELLEDLRQLKKSIKCSFKIDISDKRLDISKYRKDLIYNLIVKSRKDIDNHIFHFWDCSKDVAIEIKKRFNYMFDKHFFDFDLKKNSEIIVIFEIIVKKVNNDL